MKRNFQKFLYRKHAILTDNIIFEAWSDEKRFCRLTGLKGAMQDLELIEGHYCLDMNWLENMVKKYQKEDLTFFYNFTKRGHAHGEALKKFVRHLNLEQDIKGLQKDFWQSIELLKNLLVFHEGTHPLAKIIELKIADILIAHGCGKDVQELMIHLAKPQKFNDSVKAEKELSRIKEKRLEYNFDLKAALKNHTAKYSFLGYREPFSQGYTASFFKKRMSELATDKEARKTVKINIDFSAEEKRQIALLKEFVFFRNYRGEKLYEALFFLEPLWIKIAKHYKLTEEIDLGFYLLDEVAALFKKGKKVKDNILEERKKGFGFLLSNGKIKLIKGKELVKKKTFLDAPREEVKEIKGIVACSGKVKGRAKIIMTTSQKDKIKSGDILIAPMTTPDFLPAMKKAVAFVTDEGGITCHAAIVAREMGKPCLIGTKIATQVLKDGDFIEVNADEGVVKIL